MTLNPFLQGSLPLHRVLQSLLMTSQVTEGLLGVCSVFIDSMTDQEIRELLPSTRQGHCNTAKLTIYELSKALASSNASLYAKMANSAHLRSSLTSSNTALATLVHAAMDSGKVTHS